MLPLPSFLAPARVGASLLNRLLGREPWARERLVRHAGKTVRFDVAGFRLGLGIQSDGCVHSCDPAIVPDVSLAIPADKFGQLPSVLRNSNPDDIVQLMHIQGDAGLAHTVADLARHLRFDFEDELADVIGDVAAVRVLSAMGAVNQGVRRSGQRLAGNVSEYLSEESRQVLGRSAFQDWCEALQAAEQRIQALELRLPRLEHGLVTRVRSRQC